MNYRLVVSLTLLLSGCAQEFALIPFSPEQQASEAQLRALPDMDAKLALAGMYVQHNRIDDADALLSELARSAPDNAQVRAWHGANDCKKAGRKGPWLMGLDKLYLVYRCLDDVQVALAAAPDDFTVQMVQMNTGAEVDMFGSLDAAARTLDRVDAMLARGNSGLAPDVIAQVHVTAAKIERRRGNTTQARGRLVQAARLAATPTTLAAVANEHAAIK